MNSTISQTTAETMALQAVAFLLQDAEVLERFLRNTGVQPEDLRANLTDPAQLSCVCAFLLTDDALVLDFCRRYAYRAEDLHKAQILLDRESTAGQSHRG